MSKKLILQPCKVSSGQVNPIKGSEFEVMLNPSGFSYDHSITYDQCTSDDPDCQAGKDALGRLAPEPKFKQYGAETVNFDIVIDGTGVVRVKGRSSLPSVGKQIASIKDIVYKYDGTLHEPRVVRIIWGNFTFDGRLTSLKVEYTLFKPDGVPLRAKLTFSFMRYISQQASALKAKQSSPDLTHQVLVKAGDTLPALCEHIYDDYSYYPEIAKINGLRNFRDLRPGMSLRFPPLS